MTRLPDDPQRAWAYLAPEPLRREGAVGPLGGLSFSVKDLFGVTGWPLTASTRAALPAVPPSPLVERLLDLGAAALGKTHLHEIAMGITGDNAFGGTGHPWLPGRVSGGSSSGAAVSAALGQVDFALGTDTGGSIRVPAAWCGVYGYKPTKGHPAWPTEGVLPLSVTCDHAGPLARDLSVLVRVQTALTGQPLPAADWRGVRLGVWNPAGWLTEEAARSLLDWADRLAALGAECISLDLPEMLDAYSPIVGHEAALTHAAALARPQPGFSPDVLDRLRAGAALSAQEVAAAHQRRHHYRTLLQAALQRCDLILAPVVPSPPPRRGDDDVELPAGLVPLRRATLRLNVPFSLLGLPAVVLPGSQPWTGVQLVGRWHADDALLAYALAATA